MNANAVIAAVAGTGPPGQPPPEASTVTSDGQPFALLMAQALDGEPGIEGVMVPSLPGATQASKVVAALTADLALLANPEGIEATSVGLDRLAEVTEDEPSPEEATEDLLTVIPALVPWAPPVPPASTEAGPGLLVAPVHTELVVGPAASEVATTLTSSAPGVDGPPSVAAASETAAPSVKEAADSATTAAASEPSAPVATAASPAGGDNTSPGPNGDSSARAAVDVLSPMADNHSSSPVAPEDTLRDSGSSSEPRALEPAGDNGAPAAPTRALEGGVAPSPSAGGLPVPTGPGAPAAAATGVASPAFDALDATQPASMPPSLADSVASAVRVGQDELRLVLNPPDLGQLDVRIVETSDGLRVSLNASTREASELIQQQLPSLHSALEARDLRVDRLEVRASVGGGLDQPGERGGRQGNPEPEQAPELSSVAAAGRASEGTSARGILHRPGGRLDLVA